jgi:ubiquinone/menaquinone biosynthesis C-methylase UbiE
MNEVYMSLQHRVCPVQHAGSLDNTIRRWLQNPVKILAPHIREGMTTVDLGCGPGFFTLDMARLVGRFGRVIAVDLQSGMLAKVRGKIKGTELEDRITLHQCGETSLGLSGQIDFLLAFYMIHEIPEKDTLFYELAEIMAPKGTILIVEPPIHVSRADFNKTLEVARNAGFALSQGPKVFFSKTAILKKDRGSQQIAG